MPQTEAQPTDLARNLRCWAIAGRQADGCNTGASPDEPAGVSVGFGSVQYIHHSRGRTGTPWDDGYKFWLVQAETYLMLGQRQWRGVS
jgi:hypothetical protein